ncbi:MAG: hypothetical protein ACK4FS_06515 [Flavobacterium sp.]
MKYYIILCFYLILFTGCATTATFPVSDVVPAAEIKVKKKSDKNGNHTLEITAQHLAGADRLNPPANNYSVWIVTQDHGIKNLGQMQVRNTRKTTFKTSTPFDFSEIFITAESQGDLRYPSGREISRTKI